MIVAASRFHVQLSVHGIPSSSELAGLSSAKEQCVPHAFKRSTAQVEYVAVCCVLLILAKNALSGLS
jgi:hypothetical protein